jgi:hypothetical protein
MSGENDPILDHVAQKPKRRLWLRVIGWSAALVALFLLGSFWLLVRVAHRPSPVHATLTPAEIASEEAYLKGLGLILPDGSLLKEQPFAPPWTSHSLLTPSSWSRQPGIKMLIGPRHVRADLLLADLDVLEPVMERAYGGWDSAAARGWNWNQWFADWRKQLAAEGSDQIPFDQAFAPFDALIAFQRDNHTQIPLNRWSTYDGSQTALLASAPGAPCEEIRAGGNSFPIAPNDPGLHPRGAKLWKSGSKSFADTSYISMPSSYGAPQSVRCGGAWIPLHPIASPGGAGWSPVLRAMWAELHRDPTRIERFGEGVAYARLPTFSWKNYEQVSRAGWAHRVPEDRVLIVDLRDNSGGSWGYGLDALKDWFDDSRMIPFGDLGKELTSSCLYAPLRWNYSIQSTPAILPDQKEFLQDQLHQMAKPYPPGCPRTVAVSSPKWTYLQRRFDPKPGDLRVLVLVNSRCGSDCEMLTTELASLPQTIVAGVNTFGVGQFMQPGYSVLPRTGLSYRIALGRSNLYGDNRSFDGYGLDVDIVLPEIDSMKPEQMRELAKIVARM